MDFKPPSLLLNQRNKIIDPAKGLVIWCSNCNTEGQLQIFDGTTWLNTLSRDASDTIPDQVGQTLQVGDVHGGGIVGYLLKSGDPGYDLNVQHGLIITPMDISFFEDEIFYTTSVAWGCDGVSVAGTSGALGSGLTNTLITTSACPDTGAARICIDFEYNGYDDWYLPSTTELVLTLTNGASIDGESLMGDYWSSTNANANSAYTISSQTLAPTNSSRGNYAKIRPIRSF